MSTNRCEKHDCEMKIPAFSPDAPVPVEFRKPYCPACVEEAKERDEQELRRRDAEEEAKKRQRNEVSKYAHLQIGKRFERSTFENYEAKTKEQQFAKAVCQRYAETFRDRLDCGDGMILSGNPGTGKNHLAAAIAKAVCDQGKTVVHTTAMKLLREIKETWNKGSQKTEREAIALFILPDLLIIDEVGVQFCSTTEQILLMEVINSRYSEMRPTILISMLTIEDLVSGIGPQVVDRFREGKSAVVKFTWDSHRGK